MIDCSPQSKSIPTKTLGLPDLAVYASPKIAEKYKTLETLMDESNTTAFIVLKNDSIIYERYANGVNKGDITQVFSVTKVFVTTMLGIALEDGYIKSMDQPVSDFLPEYKEGPYADITLFHLAQMLSGFNYDEYGNLLQTVRFYYNKDVKQAIVRPNFKYEPGKVFKYKSIDTQVLGECIEKAVGKPFMDYFYEKLWLKLSPEDTAMWSIDSPEKQSLKYYGGLNVSARDLAKFGIMIANDGVYKGNIVVDSGYLNSCNDTQCRNGDFRYCHGWYYDKCMDGEDVYYGAGFGGQIVMINEKTNTVIVRLGKNKGGVVWYPLMKKLSEELDVKM